jgi:hypothetical protein
VADEYVAAAEAILLLQEAQRRPDVLDVVWVKGAAVLLGRRALPVLRELGVRAQPVVDGRERRY